MLAFSHSLLSECVVEISPTTLTTTKTMLPGSHPGGEPGQDGEGFEKHRECGAWYIEFRRSLHDGNHFGDDGIFR